MMRVRITERPDERRPVARRLPTSAKSSAPVRSTSRRASRSRFAVSRSITCPRSGRGSSASGSLSLQTGMDNIRNVIGCAAGRPDAARAVRRLAGRARVHADVPAEQGVHEPAAQVQRRHQRLHRALHARRVAGPGADAGHQGGRRQKGRRVQRRGRRQDGIRRLPNRLAARHLRRARATPRRSVPEIVLLFRDHGSRAARNKARLAFLVESWGVGKVPGEVQSADGAAAFARRAATHACTQSADHLGIDRQKQTGLNYVGLAVPVGRITARPTRARSRVSRRRTATATSD